MTEVSILKKSPRSSVLAFGNYLVEQFCQDELLLMYMQSNPTLSYREKRQLSLMTGRNLFIKGLLGLSIVMLIPTIILHFVIWLI